MERSPVRLALLLGLLSIVGPFSVDMYLPAFPAVSADLGGSASNTQMTLTTFLLGFGGAQMFYGPLADRVGRRPPLASGLLIFSASSVGCAVAVSIEWLAFFRAGQGIGAAALMVIPRAVIRDIETGPRATRLMAVMMLVASVSPMLAPLAGAGVLAIGSWRTIFWALCLAGLISLAMTVFVLDETLPPERRGSPDFRSIGRMAALLCRDASFVLPTLVGGLAWSSFFILVASAAFVYAAEFGMNAWGFSLAFALNAAGLFAASQVVGRLSARFGLSAVLRSAAAGLACGTAMLLALGVGEFAGLRVTLALLLLSSACLGFIFPTSAVLALEEQGAVAGLAAALAGTIQMTMGALAIAIFTALQETDVVSMAAGMALCGSCALGISLLMPWSART